MSRWCNTVEVMTSNLPAWFDSFLLSNNLL